LRTKAYRSFNASFDIAGFADLIEQLCNYHKVLKKLAWASEKKAVSEATKELVLKYANAITRSESFKEKKVNDRFVIIGSMLLAADRLFNLHFGFLKLHLEAIQKVTTLSGSNQCPKCQSRGLTKNCSYGDGVLYCSSCGSRCIQRDTIICPSCRRSGFTNHGASLELSTGANGGGIARCRYRNCQFDIQEASWPEMKVENGVLVPKGDTLLVTVPESLNDPNHFGHVLWKGCRLLNEIEVGSA